MLKKRKILVTVIGFLMFLMLFSVSGFASLKHYRLTEPVGKVAAEYIRGVLSFAGIADISVVPKIENGTAVYKLIYNYPYIKDAGLSTGGSNRKDFEDALNKIVNNIMSWPSEYKQDYIILEGLEDGKIIHGDVTDKCVLLQLQELLEGYGINLEKKIEEREPLIMGEGTQFRNFLELILGNVDLENPNHKSIYDSYKRQIMRSTVDQSIYACSEVRIKLETQYALKNFYGDINNFVKNYTGEDFSILIGRHSGILSYFAEWLASRHKEKGINMGSRDEYLAEAEDVNNYIKIMSNLAGTIRDSLYKGGSVNIGSFVELPIVRYFGDLVYSGENIESVKSEIEQYASKIKEAFESSDSLKSAVSQYTGRDYNYQEDARFTAMTLGRALSVIEGKIIDNYKSAHKNDIEAQNIDSEVENRNRLFQVIREGRTGENKLEIDKVTDLNMIVARTDKGDIALEDWMSRLINDMAFLKGKIDEIFGEGTIDISNMSHENFLLEYVIRMADSRDIFNLNEEDTQLVITNELIDAYNELRSMEQNGKIPEGVNIFDYFTGEWNVPQEQQGVLPDIYMYPDFSGDIPVLNL